jgi:hypothetical protein
MCFGCISFEYVQGKLEVDDLLFRRETLYDDMALRRKRYTEILAPLERELCLSFPDVKFDKLRSKPLSFSFWDHDDLGPRKQKESRQIRDYSQRPLDPAQQSKGMVELESAARKLSFNSELQFLSTAPIFFHDVITLKIEWVCRCLVTM